MSELLLAFSAGNAAILTNVCMLPLYPGLIAFLTGSASNERSRKATGWLGALVLAGIISMMVAIGLVLYLLNQSFGSVLSIMLPLIYALVIILGVLMLSDRNPFTRLQTSQAPILRNPYLTAYVYGLLFAPMTLPCTGPIILSAFVIGANDSNMLVDGIAYFIAFGLGFGWPLLILPLMAIPLQRHFVSWLTHNHLLLTRLSGVLLVGVGVFGILVDLMPIWFAEQRFEVTQTGIIVYWGVVIAIAVWISFSTYQRNRAKE